MDSTSSITESFVYRERERERESLVIVWKFSDNVFFHWLGLSKFHMS